MSPDEILADLRDIHLPAAETGTTLATDFSFWPLVLVSILVAGLAVLRRWRRGRETRKLLQDIDAFAAAPDNGGMGQLLSLRNRAAATGTPLPVLPGSSFSPDGAEDRGMLSDAARELQRAVAR